MAEAEKYPPISGYALIGDTRSCALVSRDGSIDWCCLPRFDSSALFARLLHWDGGGYFLFAPRDVERVTRRYLPGTNILETNFVTTTGTARLVDFMPIHDEREPGQQEHGARWHGIGRILACDSGRVDYVLRCVPRFDYGTIVPHVHPNGDVGAGFAHGGPDAISLHCSMRLTADDAAFACEGTLAAGESASVALCYDRRDSLRPGDFTSHAVEALPPGEVERALEATRAYWERWIARCSYTGEYRDDVVRSALVLKALTYSPSGGLVAAATTSLPEDIGGERNWDYRYTWIRDASFAVYALTIVGFREEAAAFKSWLEWSTVGRARDLQVLYGLGGERRLTEIVLERLEGYRQSRPVRIGNAASSQLQLDVYGELMDSAHVYRRFGGGIDPEYWDYLSRVVDFTLDHWQDPDQGIWESRGAPQHFVFSKAMCWVVLDRAIKAAKALSLPADLDRWRAVRQEIREQVLARGYDEGAGAFVQCYGSKNLDASVLMLPLFGFIDARDPRMVSTVARIERDLVSEQGLVWRYRDFDDGLHGGEGTFTMCTLWLASILVMQGEIDRGRRLFEQVRGYANDVGLLSEEIDARTGEALGNFPQAFTHMGLINTAVLLERAGRRRDPQPAG